MDLKQQCKDAIARLNQEDEALGIEVAQLAEKLKDARARKCKVAEELKSHLKIADILAGPKKRGPRKPREAVTPAQEEVATN